MNADVKAAWIKALRSGDYAQARGALRKDDTFCCLGVLCDLAIDAKVVEPWRVDSVTKRPEGDETEYGVPGSGNLLATATLPAAVRHWAGLDDHNPDVRIAGLAPLAHFNDAGESFDVIADAIEDQL